MSSLKFIIIMHVMIQLFWFQKKANYSNTEEFTPILQVIKDINLK